MNIWRSVIIRKIGGMSVFLSKPFDEGRMLATTLLLWVCCVCILKPAPASDIELK